MKMSDLKAKWEQLGGDKAVKTATEKAAKLAHENRDKVGNIVDRAGKAVDERTHGKYSDKVEKVKGTVVTGVDKLAHKSEGGASSMPATDVPATAMPAPDVPGAGAPVTAMPPVAVPPTTPGMGVPTVMPETPPVAPDPLSPSADVPAIDETPPERY